MPRKSTTPPYSVIGYIGQETRTFSSFFEIEREFGIHQYAVLGSILRDTSVSGMEFDFSADTPQSSVLYYVHWYSKKRCGHEPDFIDLDEFPTYGNILENA